MTMDWRSLRARGMALPDTANNNVRWMPRVGRYRVRLDRIAALAISWAPIVLGFIALGLLKKAWGQ